MLFTSSYKLASLALLARTAAAWDCKLSLGNDQFDLTKVSPDKLAPLRLASSQADLDPPIQLDKVHAIEREVPTPPTTTKVCPPSAPPPARACVRTDSPVSRAQYTYSLSLCQPLPLSSEAETCPDDTYLCGIVESVKAGHDNWLISVLPIARETNLNPTAQYLEGETTLAKGWTLSLGGGSYNEVDQKVQVEMVCDAGASSDVSPARHLALLFAGG